MLVALIVAMPAPAFADITAFLGLLNKPDQHMTRGVSAGVGLLVVAFEFEYANTAPR